MSTVQKKQNDNIFKNLELYYPIPSEAPILTSNRLCPND